MLAVISLIIVITILSDLSTPVNGCGGPVEGEIDDFTISFNVNCEDDTVTLIIQNQKYADNWWGVLFGDSMFGAESLLYTTGTSSDNGVLTTVEEGFWPYTLGATSRETSSFVLNDQYWTEMSTIHNGDYLTVTYQAALADTDWDTTTQSVDVRFAVGTAADGLTVKSYHQSRTATLTLELNAATPTPTMEPTMAPSASPLDLGEFQLCVEKSGFGYGHLEMYRNQNHRMQIHITGPSYAWFSVGFGSNKMKGTYAIIGSGSPFDVQEKTLGWHSGGSLMESSGNYSITQSGNFRTIVLERDYNVAGHYDFTDFMECNSDSEKEYIQVITAIGRSDTYKYHSLRTSGEAHNDCCGPDTHVTNAANVQRTVVSVVVACGVLMWAW